MKNLLNNLFKSKKKPADVSYEELCLNPKGEINNFCKNEFIKVK